MSKFASRRLISALGTMLFLLLSMCSDGSNGHNEPVEQQCEYTVEYAGNMMLVSPADCNIKFNLSDGSTRLKSYSPIFGNNPSPDPVPVDYFFLIREGRDEDGQLSKNILINFMGGGACWAGTNCLDSKTNITWDDIQFIATNPALLTLVQKGIILSTNENNPFNDWTLVYLPYTTGDIHWGSNDQEYTDADGVRKTVYHRGHENFLAVLRYIRDNYPPDTIDKIFVAGQSAGAYGAIFSFPYVKETYKNSTVWCLGDGGMGVTNQTFIDSIINNWKAAENLPDWIPGIDAESFRHMTTGEFIEAIANYYSDSLIAQYTAKYDHNQRFYYYVMLNIDEPELWDFMDGDGYYVPDEISCEWTEIMLDHIKTAQSAPNYNAYVAPGEIHTITTSEDIYTAISNGVSLITWLNQMLDLDPNWISVECDETDDGCQRPATFESPLGIDCTPQDLVPD